MILAEVRTAGNQPFSNSFDWYWTASFEVRPLMRAVFLESGNVSVASVDLPERKPGHALIQVAIAGICNTDLELQRGYYGFSGTPGHEFVGRVTESSKPHLVGQRVVGEINLACGRCSFCNSGLRRHCSSRTVLGIMQHPGAFSEFVTLPEENLHVLPDTIADEQAVFVEPLAAACEILDQVAVRAGERVAVLGAGKLGLLVAQVLQTAGAEVVLFGRHKENLGFLRESGIVIAEDDDRPVQQYRIVVDCTGSPEGLREALRMVQPRGTVALKSTVHQPVTLDMAPVIVNEISLVGSRCGRFEPAIRLLAERRVQVQPMIAARYPLSDAAAAFAKASQRGVLKVLLEAA